MRNMSNTARFFIVCAVIFCIGLVTTVAGVATGGIEGMKKIAHHNEWINEGPGELTTEYMEMEDFDAVEVSGDADMFILSEEFYTDRVWMDDHSSLKMKSMLANTGVSTPESGHVLVVRGSNAGKPDIKVEEGVLKIKSPETKYSSGISFNFSEAPYTPVIYVFCDKAKLSSIKTDTLAGDVKIAGMKFEKADLMSASGDILMDDVSVKATSMTLKYGDAFLSGKFAGPTTVTATAGDVKMEGKLQGDTTINMTSGDVEIDATLPSTEYKLDLKALAGDIEISENGEKTEEYDSPSTVQHGEGPNTIKIDSTSGDIDMSFGELEL